MTTTRYRHLSRTGARRDVGPKLLLCEMTCEGIEAFPAKSLMRMFGPKGNPQAKHLFDVIATLQQAEGVQFQVR